MYSIVRQLDFLEKANTRGAFSINDEQDVYAKACDKLLIQYKVCLAFTKVVASVLLEECSFAVVCLGQYLR